MTRYLQDPRSDLGSDRVALDTLYTGPSGQRHACAVVDRSVVPGHVLVVLAPAGEPVVWTVPEYMTEYQGWGWNGVIDDEVDA